MRRERVALAAALVETALDLQGLGLAPAEPMQLLLGDLYLARAYGLLADDGDPRVQAAFARAIEHVAAAAGAGQRTVVRRVLFETLDRAVGEAAG